MSETELAAEAIELLKEEEGALKDTYENLLTQRQKRLASVHKEGIKARELTSQLVAAQNDEDKQLLASDETVSHGMVERHIQEAGALETLLEKPYFARIVLEEERNGKIVNIEYKIGNASNIDCRIIDWRKAPLSKLYYEYKEGEEYFEEIQGREREGTIKLRNTIEAERDSIQQVICRYGSFTKDGDKWVVGSARGGKRQGAGTLPDVLALITADQFQAITQEAESSVLIQGAAGSGKTTVALHRLSWLLHEDNTSWSPGEVKILVLSKVLKKYIQNSLPQLEIAGVPVSTIGEWHRDLVKSAFPKFIDEDGDIHRPSKPCPQSIRRVKESMAVFKALEQYCLEKREQIITKLEQSLELTGLPTGVKALLDKHKQIGSAIFVLLDELAEALKKSRRFVKEETAQNHISEGLSLIEQLKKDCSHHEQDLIKVLSNDELIVEADDTKLIDRNLARSAYEFTAECIEDNTIHDTDDPLLLRMYQLKYGGIPSKTGSPTKYKHLVVDEVQDLGPAELAVIVGSVEKLSGLTLVGDVNQRIRTVSTFPGWDALRKYWSLGEDLSSFISLNVSHRSTREIMAAASALVETEPPNDGRSGRKPIWFQCLREETGIQEAITWLGKAMERYPHSLTAVVCADRKEAKHVESMLKPSFGHAVRFGDEHSFSFDEGIIVTEPQSIKGLEFTNVLVWNPSYRAYRRDQLSQNKLYVAFTRAEENLCIITWGKPSNILTAVPSRYFRIVPEEIEEEEPEVKGFDRYD